MRDLVKVLNYHFIKEKTNVHQSYIFEQLKETVLSGPHDLLHQEAHALNQGKKPASVDEQDQNLRIALGETSSVQEQLLPHCFK